MVYIRLNSNIIDRYVNYSISQLNIFNSKKLKACKKQSILTDCGFSSGRSYQNFLGCIVYFVDHCYKTIKLYYTTLYSLQKYNGPKFLNYEKTISFVQFNGNTIIYRQVDILLLGSIFCYGNCVHCFLKIHM